jgi:protocatechuate 3,4-dioxygenase beta subunit
MTTMTSDHLFRTAPLVAILALVWAAPVDSREMADQIAPAPPRDARPAAPVGTAVISGVVSVGGTGQPARGARVSVSGPDVGNRSAITDEMGRFAFNALPAGRYTLSASKPGHVNVTYGQRRPGAGRPGTPIQLADGQRFDARMQLPRGGVITGTLLDENGEAVPGTQVRAMRYVLQTGQRTLQQAGSDATDDRGMYRIYGLQPGDYVVAAVPRNINVSAEMRTDRIDMDGQVVFSSGGNQAQAVEFQANAKMREAQMLQDEQPAGYAPVYYPGTTTATQAASVPVGVAEERSGIDFQLQRVAIARIDGFVISPAGQVLQNIQIQLVNTGQDVQGLGGNATRADANGRFTISNVAPGQYMLFARATIGGRVGGEIESVAGGQPTVAVRRAEGTRLWASADLAVDGRNVSNVVLTLQPGMPVSGRVAFEGTTLPPPQDPSRIRVSLTPADPAGRSFAGAVTGRADATGRFAIAGVIPGRYRLTASGAGNGWFLESSILDGQDTLDFPIEVKPNQSITNGVITFTDRQTELSGVITNEQAQPTPDYTIIVYPSDQRYWIPSSRRIQTTRPATDGRFSFRNLPPGEYRIAPLIDPEPGAWYDPAFLQQLDDGALRVSLLDGEKKVQDLRVR